jgi:hypothetical protein
MCPRAHSPRRSTPAPATQPPHARPRRAKQGSNLFWFEGQKLSKPLGLMTLEGVAVEARAVVNRSGEKPHALHVQLPGDVCQAAEAHPHSRPHLTIAAPTQELQVAGKATGGVVEQPWTPPPRLNGAQGKCKAASKGCCAEWRVACSSWAVAPWHAKQPRSLPALAHPSACARTGVFTLPLHLQELWQRALAQAAIPRPELLAQLQQEGR